ncbi:helix-turn-helix domain-containing protein [Haloarchaeobius sp. TZWSO28]|uniref:helix-turn-helix domain-containing protein n=1 Tax=Haloarchaeobius sp. TZWSO28 TaxID=3446119 RepID=UPI003EBB0103
MIITGRFKLPVEKFPLGEAILTVPGTQVKFVRVTISPNVLSRYFWATTDDFDAFEAAAVADPSVASLTRVDTFEGSALFRVEWNEERGTIASIYADIDGTFLNTAGNSDGWLLRVDFADQSGLVTFRDQLVEAGVNFSTLQLSRREQIQPGSGFGLTPKQTVAMARLWEFGYFDTPRKATLAEVAADLGISQQALSDRLRRAQWSLVKYTLITGSDIDLFGADESLT